jgi:NDP-sugar pyrophosphorylase family protein
VQAVILAGGLGTRLWPVTRDVPKPMVPVAGKPYLEYQLRLLARQSITDIVLLTGYLGEQIEEHFGDGSRLGLSIRYSREHCPIGTGGALRLAGALLDETFLVIYGDSYLPIDYRVPFERLSACPSATGLLVLFHDPSGETAVSPNVALSAAGLVTRYDKDSPGDPELRYVEAGVLALRREVLDDIPAAVMISLEKEVFPKLIGRGRLLGWATTQRFYDIGTPERLRVIEDLLA